MLRRSGLLLWQQLMQPSEAAAPTKITLGFNAHGHLARQLQRGSRCMIPGAKKSVEHLCFRVPHGDLH